MADDKRVRFKIKRQDTATSPARWEDFTLPWEPMMNVISALMQIQRNPVTSSGRRTTPVSYSSNCLEEVCGACTMVINAKVRQSCSALVDNLKQPIPLEPMTNHPIVRDLYFHRER